MNYGIYTEATERVGKQNSEKKKETEIVVEDQERPSIIILDEDSIDYEEEIDSRLVKIVKPIKNKSDDEKVQLSLQNISEKLNHLHVNLKRYEEGVREVRENMPSRQSGVESESIEDGSS